MNSRAMDEQFMKAALVEARKGLGQTSPNPAVGAVLVINGGIAATGYHHQAGSPHAEVECLRDYGKRLPSAAELYVTLEPCSTIGRTPPCTTAILKAGIKNVAVGALDPNPQHQGRGVELLRAAGVSVRTGILAEKCSALNEAFNKWVRTRRPFVIAKCGMTLDGRLTLPPGDGRWVTSPASRRYANRRRAFVDAIMIGAETLRVDNPRLTVRGIQGARQPWRVVLAGNGRLPKGSHLFTDRFQDRTLVFRNEPMEAVLSSLGEREITSVLIEGGGHVLGQALEGRLIDRVEIYLGAVFSGGPVVAFPGRGAASTAEGVSLRDISYEKIGNDVFIEAAAK